MEKLELNYMELAFIMDMPTVESKAIFLNFLNLDKVGKNDMISVKDLKVNFEKVRSLDCRYDGQNKLLFYLEHKKKLFKKFLNDKAVVKSKKFNGGKSIFYKILDEKDLNFIKDNLNYKHEYLYGKK